MRWTSILLLAFPAIGLAEPEPEFHLCSSYVEKSAVGEQSDLGWPVSVKLTEVGATSFDIFTEVNTGKTIRVVVGRREFSKATVWGGCSRWTFTWDIQLPGSCYGLAANFNRRPAGSPVRCKELRVPTLRMRGRLEEFTCWRRACVR